MVRQSLVFIFATGLALQAGAGSPVARAGRPVPAASTSQAPWPVSASLKTTLGNWAQRAGWPAPQFLTDADWPVDVPGSLPGSIEEALKLLAEGFGRAAARPRIELTVNHVIVVTEIGAE